MMNGRKTLMNLLEAVMNDGKDGGEGSSTNCYSYAFPY